jgi:16S rRNA (adenine1518-N6/adenine1519-N6)-dimethyltransferase
MPMGADEAASDPAASERVRELVDLLLDRSRPDTRLGQHFLLDDAVLARAVELAGLQQADTAASARVLEVGPGPGTLTQKLLDAGVFVHAIELDAAATAHLARVFSAEIADQRLEVVEGDALALAWPAGLTHVVCNPPYQISSPLIERIERYQRDAVRGGGAGLAAVVLLLQEEFAVKVGMTAGESSRGPLGMSLAFSWRSELDLKVPPHSFSPHPAVDSRMVRLTPEDLATALRQDPEHPLGDSLEPADARFSRLLVRHCFEQRRKKLRNRLARPPKRLERIPGWHRSRWSEAVQALSRDDGLVGLPSGFLDLRPESLTQQEWLTLSSWLSTLEIGTLQAD